MNSKEITKKHFDENAGKYDDSYDGKFVKCMYDELVESIMETGGKNILDLGCGNGNVLKRLLNNNLQLFGVDLSPEMIKEASKNINGEGELKVGDSENIPYEDGIFDVVICNASFHHYTKPEKSLSEIKRVLKKGGKFILGDPTAPSKLYLKILNWGLKYSNSGDYKIYYKDEIINLLQKNGFNVESYKKINHRSFMINAKSV